ncbi:transcription repressor OFP8-like [Rutidosis leptorrhynchoides]|uniref:transcription repressor OFP8-like n=1 Tax=Rutidosis leptorrhynchoides TaxID=125765 RepID=UPI003A9A0500
MENRLKKLQISKLIQSTFNSCRPKNTSDVSDHHKFFPGNTNHRRLIDLFSPKPQPHSLYVVKQKPHLPHTGKPHFPATPDRRRQYFVTPAFDQTSTKDRKRKPRHRRRRNNLSFSSITDNNYYNFWTSDENDDQSECKTTNTLFSKQSVSSDSGAVAGGSGDVRLKNVIGLDGFALSKESSDPYEDFRVSMVDMIIEKGIFSVEELENLVDCFIKLNSEEHHKVIYEVFAEIWETMISDMYKRA